MKNSWLTAASMALLCAGVSVQPALAAARKPKTAVKKQAPKPPPPAPVTNKLADTPDVKDATSVWRGCLDLQDLPRLASGLGVEESRLEPLLSNLGLLSRESPKCVPYLAASGGAGGASSAIFRRPDAKPGEAPVLALHKSGDGITITPGACDCPDSTRRVLDIPVRDADQKSNEILASIPSNVRWQLDTLLPKMTSGVAAEVSAGPTMRIALDRRTVNGPEYLQSVEILDSATGNRVNGAWWLERPGGPGVLIGTDGVELERLLWQSPLKYVQKSRGVGPAVATYSRRVNPPKGKLGKAFVRTFTVREYHVGSDLLAPKGTEVHAVGDSKVAFAGRMGGYGNLIILDHGLGFQTYYAHLSVIKPFIKAGVAVSRGDLIGLVGSTGRSTGPHLHFETRKDSKFIDPFDNSRLLDFWLLTPDDQERLAMQQLLIPPQSVPTDEGSSAPDDRPHDTPKPSRQ